MEIQKKAALFFHKNRKKAENSIYITEPVMHKAMNYTIDTLR